MLRSDAWHSSGSRTASTPPSLRAARLVARPCLLLAGCVLGCSSTQSSSAAISLWVPRPASSCCPCFTPSGGPVRSLWRAAARTAARLASRSCLASASRQQQKQQLTAAHSEHGCGMVSR